MFSETTPQRTRSHGFQRFVIVVGLAVGLMGLVMTILGIGGVGFTRFSFSNNIDVQTTSGGVVAMLVGFGMATFLYYSMIRVDLALANRATSVVMYYPQYAPIIPSAQGTAPASGAPRWYAPLLIGISPEQAAALSPEDLSKLFQRGKSQSAPSPTKEEEPTPYAPRVHTFRQQGTGFTLREGSQSAPSPAKEEIEPAQPVSRTPDSGQSEAVRPDNQSGN